MREKKLGRWVVRFACAIGAGVVVFGGASAASASVASGSALVLLQSSSGVSIDSITHWGEVQTKPTYLTEDYGWS